MQIHFLFSILVLITATASYINHVYLKMPKTIGLTILSMLISLGLIIFFHQDSAILNIVGSFNFSETVLSGMLSYLLFAGALHVNVVDLKKELKAVISFASIGVIISCFLTATLIYGLSHLVQYPLSFGYCLVFGALISPTDPIAVMAVFKETKQVPARMKMRITGESLFNDAAGIILFVLMANLVFHPASQTDHVQISDMIHTFLSNAGGGIGLGVIFGWLGTRLIHKADDPEVAILITMAISSMGFIIAAYIEASGPITMVIAGLIIGNNNKTCSKRTKTVLNNFWGLIDELLNAFLFVLIGLEMLSIHFNPSVILLGLIGIIGIFMTRYISVFLPILIIDRNRNHDIWQETLLLSWGGIRGGISIALALSLPPEGESIVSLTYIIVICSILLQGASFKRLINHIFKHKTDQISPEK